MPNDNSLDQDALLEEILSLVSPDIQAVTEQQLQAASEDQQAVIEDQQAFTEDEVQQQAVEIDLNSVDNNGEDPVKVSKKITSNHGACAVCNSSTAGRHTYYGAGGVCLGCRLVHFFSVINAKQVPGHLKRIDYRNLKTNFVENLVLSFQSFFSAQCCPGKLHKEVQMHLRRQKDKKNTKNMQVRE